MRHKNQANPLVRLEGENKSNIRSQAMPAKSKDDIFFNLLKKKTFIYENLIKIDKKFQTRY